MRFLREFDWNFVVAQILPRFFQNFLSSFLFDYVYSLFSNEPSVSWETSPETAPSNLVMAQNQNVKHKTTIYTVNFRILFEENSLAVCGSYE